MHAEDDEHLPDAAHQNGGQCGNVVGKEVVGSSNGVCQHIGHRADDQNSQGNHNNGADKGHSQRLDDVGQMLVQPVLQPAEHQHQEQRRQHGGGVGGLAHGEGQELDDLTVCDAGSDGSSVRVDQRHAAPHGNEGVTLEVLGSSDGDHDRQEGEGRPADEAEHGIRTGGRKSGEEVGNDDQCALHQTGCGQNVHKGCEHGGHGGDDAAAEALLDFRRGSGAVVQIQQLGQCFVHVLGMGADDHLILAAAFHHLDDGGHLGDLFGHFVRGCFPQHQTQAGGTVGRAEDIVLADGGTDVGGKLCVIADFVCHDVLSFSSDHGFALCPHYTEEKPHCQLI